MSKARKIKDKEKTKNMVVKTQEAKWNDSTVGTIPEYNADSDRCCPRAQSTKYNSAQKNAVLQSKMRTIEASWLSNTLQNKFEDVPLKLTKTLRQKASSLDGNIVDGQIEVEILQKIIVRENFLLELETLLNNQISMGDIHSCVNEVVELVKAVRYQTVDIVEEIEQWQLMQPSKRAFLYRGMNYLIKIITDLNYLDKFDEIMERFCFEFKNNPLAYRWGGDIQLPNMAALMSEAQAKEGSNYVHLTGELQYQQYRQEQKQYNKNIPQAIDGIDISRLRHAEEVISGEIQRVNNEKLYRTTKNVSDGVNETTGEDKWNEMNTSSMNDGSNQDGNDANGFKNSILSGSTSVPNGINMNKEEPFSKYKRISTKLKINPDKIKKEKILKKTEEIQEMQAIQCHLEEQIQVLVSNYQEHTQSKLILEHRLKEAKSLNRTLAAQTISIDISILIADMEQCNTKIRDHQRQIYFLTEEMKRHKKIVAGLRAELDLEKQRKVLQKQISTNIQEEGLSKALKAFNKIATASPTKSFDKPLLANLDDNLANLSMESEPPGGPMSPAQKLLNNLFDAVKEDEEDAHQQKEKNSMGRSKNINKYGGKVSAKDKKTHPTALRSSIHKARQSSVENYSDSRDVYIPDATADDASNAQIETDGQNTSMERPNNVVHALEENHSYSSSKYGDSSDDEEKRSHRVQPQVYDFLHGIQGKMTSHATVGDIVPFSSTFSKTAPINEENELNYFNNKYTHEANNSCASGDKNHFHDEDVVFAQLEVFTHEPHVHGNLLDSYPLDSTPSGIGSGHFPFSKLNSSILQSPEAEAVVAAPVGVLDVATMNELVADISEYCMHQATNLVMKCTIEKLEQVLLAEQLPADELETSANFPDTVLVNDGYKSIKSLRESKKL